MVICIWLWIFTSVLATFFCFQGPQPVEQACLCKCELKKLWMTGNGANLYTASYCIYSAFLLPQVSFVCAVCKSLIVACAICKTCLWHWQEWWTHLWLNEGFASWIEYLCVDHCFPEYDVWTQFINTDLGRALELDALDNSHPIEVRLVLYSHLRHQPPHWGETGPLFTP